MSTASPEFNAENYLEQRKANSSFVMVEFGHSGAPVAYQQPFEFKDKRAYVGVEAWLRDPANSRREDLVELREAENQESNITYMDIDPGGITRKRHKGASPHYEGEYNPTTLLPDGAADEVVAINVFCDVHLAGSLERTAKLLAEMSRLTDTDGEIVLRESISPKEVTFLSQQVLTEAGLQTDARIGVEDEEWEKLEPVYEGDPLDLVMPESFYLFLSKTASTGTSLPDLGVAGAGQTAIDLP